MEINNCLCGRKHICTTETVLIENNVIEKIIDYVLNYNNILVVADTNTYPLVGKQLKDVLKNKISDMIILDGGNDVIIPNEQSIEIINNKVNGIDLIFGIGSGVINDLCKYVSFSNDLPYMIFATAPSMDGYVSVGCALILQGMKVTLNGRPPKAVFSDPKILINAPYKMIQSGYGDIIGKFSCLNDWKLSALINGEYFCQIVYDMVFNTATKIRNLAKEIKNLVPEAITELMKALIDVGLAMSYVGNSRPASGSEHHLSHYYEITGIVNHELYLTHGIDVGYSTVVTSKIREKIVNSAPHKKCFDENKWIKDINRIYKTSAKGIIELQNQLGWNKKNDYDNIVNKLDSIKKILSEAPSSDEILKMLEDVNMNYEEYVKIYGIKKIQDGILYAKDLKDRYSVLWLYFDYFLEEDI